MGVVGEAAVRRNWPHLLLAVFLAVACWYHVTGRERVDIWTPVRLEMTGAPEGLMIRGGMVASIDVLVRGPKGMTRRIEESAPVYPLNLSQLVVGRNVINFDPRVIPLSRVFDVMDIRPARIELDVERRVFREVPVKPVLRANLPESHSLVSVSTQPEQVRVGGPESLVAKTAEIRTQPIRLPDNLPLIFDEQVDLDVPNELEAAPSKTRVAMSFAVRQEEVRLKVGVRVKDEAGRDGDVNPKTVNLRLRGPLTTVTDANFRNLVEAVVEVPPGTAAGRHDSAYQVRMPQGCELLEAKPERVTLVLK